MMPDLENASLVNQQSFEQGSPSFWADVDQLTGLLLKKVFDPNKLKKHRLTRVNFRGFYLQMKDNLGI